jgi:hypothetical protein
MMSRIVMYLEVPDGRRPYESLLDSLDEIVERGGLDGYFTLTFDGDVWADREDLKKMANAVAQAQKGGA